ncbi:MAG: hypothetical protein OXU23_06565 [Candidatus Poribacteria bacterium]|nr:hypothetical protein [Candidatus Poribacteria bacterium]
MHGTKQCSTTISAGCYLSYIAIAVLLFSSSLMGCQHQVWENSLDSPDQIGLAVVDALNRKDSASINIGKMPFPKSGRTKLNGLRTL